MPLDRFDVYFSGQLLPDQDPEKVRARVAHLFRADANRIARLFSGKSIRIKRNVDVETAGKYRASMRKIGALVEIRPSQRNPVDSTPDAPTGTAVEDEAGSKLELLPAGTGSLADCAPPVPAPPTFAFAGFSLALVGTDLDDQPPHPAASIPTEHLSASPPNTGSLENYDPEQPMQTIPDISLIQIEHD